MAEKTFTLSQTLDLDNLEVSSDSEEKYLGNLSVCKNLSPASTQFQ